jgi:hypothetical protein
MAGHKGPTSSRPRCTRSGSSVAAIPVYQSIAITLLLSSQVQIFNAFNDKEFVWGLMLRASRIYVKELSFPNKTVDVRAIFFWLNVTSSSNIRIHTYICEGRIFYREYRGITIP